MILYPISICGYAYYNEYFMQCRLLNEAKGSLLDDEQLVNTLQTSKVTSQDVTEQLQTAEQTEVKIDAAREVSTRDILPEDCKEHGRQVMKRRCASFASFGSRIYKTIDANQ